MARSLVGGIDRDSLASKPAPSIQGHWDDQPRIHGLGLEETGDLALEPRAFNAIPGQQGNRV